MLVGPGRGLQLQSDAHGKAGRLLFCGHKQDPYSGRVSPIWVSDDHGESYAVKASLPRGTPAPLDRHGPDECQFAELANGARLCICAHACVCVCVCVCVLRRVIVTDDATLTCLLCGRHDRIQRAE